MDELFLGLAASEDPGAAELAQFTRDIESFMRFVVLESQEFSFLWRDAPSLVAMARGTLQEDIPGAANSLRDVIPSISPTRLDAHGLRGRPLRFKFNVLSSIARLWDSVKGKLTVRGWFKKMCEAIDAILDSLLDAAGGVGAVLKEFKDALSALVPESERA